MDKKFLEFRKNMLKRFIERKEQELAKAKEDLAKLEELAAKAEEQPQK